MDIGKGELMSIKWIGAICIIAGCGGCGFLMGFQYLAKIRLLTNLAEALDYMECELQYRCTPLPQLCRQTGQQSQGKIRQVFLLLAEELEAQISPDAQRCMAAVLDTLTGADETLCGILSSLGMSLGRFDMPGQLQGLENSRNACREKLELLKLNKDCRLRSYQTLGLCAGAAIAILFV